MSSAGMMPPPNTTMSPAPRSLATPPRAGTASCARRSAARARPRRRPPGSRSRRSARAFGATRCRSPRTRRRAAPGRRSSRRGRGRPIRASRRSLDASLACARVYRGPPACVPGTPRRRCGDGTGLRIRPSLRRRLPRVLHDGRRSPRPVVATGLVQQRRPILGERDQPAGVHRHRPDGTADPARSSRGGAVEPRRAAAALGNPRLRPPRRARHGWRRSTGARRRSRGRVTERLAGGDPARTGSIADLVRTLTTIGSGRPTTRGGSAPSTSSGRSRTWRPGGHLRMGVHSSIPSRWRTTDWIPRWPGRSPGSADTPRPPTSRRSSAGSGSRAMSATSCPRCTYPR